MFSFDHWIKNHLNKTIVWFKNAQWLKDFIWLKKTTIHDACFIIPDVGNTDENIVLYVDSRQSWVIKLWIDLQLHNFSLISIINDENTYAQEVWLLFYV